MEYNRGTNQEVDHPKRSKEYVMFVCKVCHNFNTIEWETDSPSVEEMQHMYDIVRGVHTIEETPAKPAEKPASEKQVNLLRQLGIPFKEPISSREAYNLIKGKLG